MNILSRDKQIEILAALTEGLGIRATARVAGANRKTVAQLALQVGRGAAELHDRQMVGLRVGRLELDELWAFVGKKQKQVKRTDSAASHKHGAYRFGGIRLSLTTIYRGQPIKINLSPPNAQFASPITVPSAFEVGPDHARDNRLRP